MTGQRVCEARFAATVLNGLSRYFFVDREVCGVHCTGKGLRLDAVLRPRDPSGWRDPRPVFGVEFKTALDGTRNFTAWAAQAVDYTYTDWAGYGKLMIFTCPAVSAGVGFYGAQAGRLMVRVLGQLNVGELAQTCYGWTLRLNGENIWSEGKGVHRRWSLVPKAGSR